MQKRFLNVIYQEVLTRINVTDFEDLSEVQDAIKAKYGEAIPVGPAFIQLYMDSDKKQHITHMNDISAESIPQYYQEKGPCVVIGTNDLAVDSSPSLPLSEIFPPKPVGNVIPIGGLLSPLINKVDKIFIRKPYVLLFDTIYNQGNPSKWKVLVTGTPGIGQTLLLIYCAFRLVNDYEKTVFLHIYSAAYKLIISPDGVQKFAESAFKYPEGDNWFYLADSVEPRSLACAQTILTVSPRLKFANEYAKDARPFYYMPLWDWKEIEEALNALGLQLNAENLKQRFEILDGVPRRLFDTSESAEQIVQYALSKTRPAELLAQPESGLMENFAHVLILYEANNDYRGFVARYASRYVSQKVYETLKRYGKIEMQKFVMSSAQYTHLGGLRGQLYEYLAHDLLIKGGTFQRRHLTEDERTTYSKAVEIPAASNVIKDFSKLEEVYPLSKKQKKNIYFLPKYGFEALIRGYKDTACSKSLSVKIMI